MLGILVEAGVPEAEALQRLRSNSALFAELAVPRGARR
jgi:hypothetical protein